MFSRLAAFLLVLWCVVWFWWCKGDVMVFISEAYPPRWRELRRTKLAQVGYCCEECGVPHLSLRQNTRTGQDYLVYLSIAHKKQYQTWLKEAETMVLCQRCHRRYDRQFRRKGKARTYTPVGFAKVSVHDGNHEVVAGVPSTYAELRDLVDALPDEGQTAAPGRRPLVPKSDEQIALVNGEVYADDMIEIDASSSASHFERYRPLIDSFDEDRENWFEKLVRWFFFLMAYTLPLVVAYAMGREIGDAYGGVFSWSDGWSLGTHTVAMAGEFALAMMTLSAATALRRMTQDSSYAPKFIGSCVSFLLFSLASGLAQWFIASLHIAPRDTSGLVALVFRVAMVPAVDIATTSVTSQASDATAVNEVKIRRIERTS